ncbi:MAG: hypothetical protein JKX81_10760 [Arenicella sp.]|nr:hypothetical protein [Arenicella sp.]
MTPDTRNEVSFEQFKKDERVVYEINSCRGPSFPVEVFKYIDDRIEFGIEYIYQSGTVVEIKMLYIKG